MPARREVIQRIASGARIGKALRSRASTNSLLSRASGLRAQADYARKIAEFGQVLRSRLITGDPEFRRFYVVLLAEEVTASAEQVRVSGTRSALEHLLVSEAPPFAGPVPIVDRKWCPEEDSNLHGLATAST